ncbi:MAG: SDR family NAD(P)-dependent oxidoreductase [Candidatus ainarchaeum sp.]|nr:SDR family NAD(P)-dependent oxidoreductase [Candidatus ainarchaeum sp.]
MVKKFENKWVIITGGSSGIGLATVTKLANLGAKIISIQSNKNPKNLINKKNVFSIDFDLKDIENINNLFLKIKKISKKIDFIIFNATIDSGSSVENLELDEMKKVFSANVFFPTIFMKKFIPLLNRNSAVIFISSGAPRLLLKNKSVYSMTEGCVETLAKVLAKEIAPKTRVNIVAPGPTKTKRLLCGSKESNKELIKSLEKLMPLNRINKSEDIANTIIFLISNESRNITGQTIQVNCGGIIL